MLKKIIAKIQARQERNKRIQQQRTEDSHRRKLRYDNLSSEDQR